MDYVLDKEEGIYYIYSARILFLPKVFESRQASCYLAAVELLSKYRYAADKLQFDYGKNIAFTCGLALQQDFDWLVNLPKEKISGMTMEEVSVKMDASVEDLTKLINS